MAGFGPQLIPDQLLSANHQAALARGVRLSLAERWACRRLRVSWAQTLSKRPDLSRARKVRTPWPTPAHVMVILCQDRLVCVGPRRAPDALRASSGIGRGLEIWEWFSPCLS